MTTPDPSTPPAAPPPGGEKERALTELVVESREFLVGVATMLIEREERERTWTTIKRTAGVVMVLAMLAIWATLYGPMFGWTKTPDTEVVAVIPVRGPIGDGSAGGSAKTLVPLIEKACRSSRSKAVVLAISSGGGVPGEADRIGAATRACKADGRSVPVLAVIEGTGASAAYLIAAHADEIFADRYAMVGSLGAVMRSVDAGGLAERLGIRERVYASGPLKSGNGVLSPNSAEQDALNQELVNDVGRIFAAQIRELRGERLRDDPALFSGRVWTSADARELGLIDGVASLEEVRTSKLDNVQLHEYRPRETFQDRLGLAAMSFGLALATGLRDTALE